MKPKSSIQQSTIVLTKQQATEQEKIVTSCTSGRGLHVENKQTKIPSISKTNEPVDNGVQK